MIKGALNVAAKAARRVGSAHKPMVRFARRRARERDERALRASAAAVDRDIRRVASGRAPIVAGPWLAEVGYEVLYWIPFLRWFCDVHGVPRERLIVLSRGGMEPLYREGDRVVVSPTEQVRRGDRVVVKTRDGEVMAKILARQSARQIELHSINPAYDPRIFDVADVEWMARIIWASQ